MRHFHITITCGGRRRCPTHTHMQLTKPIKPGFRRPITITPDEPVDVNAETGTFARVEVTSGDSTASVDPSSSATSIKVWLNGDGSTGDKTAVVTVDGHIGEGEVSVTLTLDYKVTTPDATSLEKFVEGPDEPIPPTP